MEYESDRSSSKEEDTRRQRKKKSKKESLIKSTEDAKWRFIKYGSKHLSLTKTKPSNSHYRKVLSYRLYRLRRITHGRTSSGTGRVQYFKTRMEVPLPRYSLNREYPIIVPDFLARSTREATIQEMLEAQVFVTLPSTLEGFAFSQNDGTVSKTLSTERGFTYCDKTLQYLLTSYA